MDMYKHPAAISQIANCVVFKIAWTTDIICKIQVCHSGTIDSCVFMCVYMCVLVSAASAIQTADLNR